MTWVVCIKLNLKLFIPIEKYKIVKLNSDFWGKLCISFRPLDPIPIYRSGFRCIWGRFFSPPSQPLCFLWENYKLFGKIRKKSYFFTYLHFKCIRRYFGNITPSINISLVSLNQYLHHLYSSLLESYISMTMIYKIVIICYNIM